MISLFNIVTSFFKKIAKMVIFYHFFIDLCLLEYFCRKYQYFLFLFAYFFGTFGYTNDGPFFHAKIACFIFSWYLIFTSFIVYCAFRFPPTKSFLYDLLGKDFVVKKIGNPGKEAWIKYFCAAMGGVFLNEAGRFADAYAITRNAQSVLDSTLSSLETERILSDKDRSDIARQAFALKNQMASKPPLGTLDRIAQIDSYNRMIENASKAGTRILGK